MRQPSDESYSSATSSKTHRRTHSFRGTLSSTGVAESVGEDDDGSLSSALNGVYLGSRRRSNDAELRHHDVVTTNYDNSPISRTKGQSYGSSGEEDKSLNTHEIEELIRQLSFSPSQQTKKRTDTADTVSSSSSFFSNTIFNHDDIPVGNSLKHNRRSSNSLMGLKFLTDWEVTRSMV